MNRSNTAESSVSDEAPPRTTITTSHYHHRLALPSPPRTTITASHYHHHDALGSTRLLTDSSGNVTDTYLHDAWGNLVASTGTTVNPFKWVGKYGYYTDNSTAQVYVRARTYQPTVARWASMDPLAFLDGLNRVAYAHSNPLNLVDPSGLKCCVCKWRRLGLGELIVGLDDGVLAHQIAAMLVRNMNSRLASKVGVGTIRDDQFLTTGFYHRRNNTRDLYLNSFLFFVTADVRECSERECVVDMKESNRWKMSYENNTWSSMPANESGQPSYSHRFPTPAEGVNAPYIYSQPLIFALSNPTHEGCTKRIIWADMPAALGSLGNGTFKRDISAIGAKQQYAVYDREFPEPRAEMRLRFDLFSDSKEPHQFSPDPVSTGGLTVGVSTFRGSSSIPEGIRCNS
jgi:RHS repeat-associated protein